MITDDLTCVLAVLVEFITQKPVHADPRDPSHLKSFHRPASQSNQGITFDPTRVDRIFKVKSMQKRIGTAGGVPGQRSKWQQTAAQEIGWYSAELIPRNQAY